jgi:hypothetical protein
MSVINECAMNPTFSLINDGKECGYAHLALRGVDVAEMILEQ